MRIGLGIASTGPQSRPATLLECARAVEDAGFSDVWLPDRIAVTPEESPETGRCLDSLSTLAWLAGQTKHVGLGMSALILPYRPPLLTAKTLATLQDLSGRRLLIGAGVGWKPLDFEVLGVPRSERGRRMDETLQFIHQCFEDDIMTANGQDFIFLPRPQKPPLYIGGAGDHALRRTIKYGDGWMPMLPWFIDRPDTVAAKELAPTCALLREMAEEAGRPRPEVIVGVDFDPKSAQDLSERFELMQEAGVDGIVTGAPFEGADEFKRNLEFLFENLPRWAAPAPQT